MALQVDQVQTRHRAQLLQQVGLQRAAAGQETRHVVEVAGHVGLHGSVPDGAVLRNGVLLVHLGSHLLLDISSLKVSAQRSQSQLP